MKENTTKIFEKRKRKVTKRLERKQWKSQAKPMFATSNIHYEIDGRHEGIACGGIGAIHLIPDCHPKYPICGHLSLPHLYFYLRGMKKEENMVIQVPIRHTELKYESDGGAYYPATSGAFSSGHPG